MQSGLRLSEAEQIGVRDEIRHHLEDSSNALVERGLVPAAATIEAIARLGSPEVLAEAINSAKLTRVRLFKGLRSASMAAVFGATMGVLAGGTTIAFTPIVARFLTFLALQVGIHIYAPENGAWWSQQLCLTACVAAFMAARRSLPFVAQHTGRAETLVRPIWALAGAIPLAIFAILLPESLDTMVVVALLGIPICFVAGTWLSQGHEDDLVSRKGIAGAVVLLAALLLAPGFRMWTFDPSAGPSAAPPSAASASAHMSWESDGAAADTWIVTVPDLDIATWHDARLEFWPAIRQGFAIVPEQSATGPTSTAALGTTVDLTALPGSNQDWWVTLTAVGPDGVRRTLAAEIHFGASGSGQQNILGQILGHG
jgi:branched-subunit amino acid transport protein AzlD